MAAEWERTRAAMALLERRLRERERRRRRREQRRARQARAEAAATTEAARAALEASDREVDESFRLVETIFRATMNSAGFLQHHRGEWRRRRPTMTNKQAGVPAAQGRGAAPAAAADRGDQAARERAVEQQLAELWRRVAAGDRTAVEALRTMYDRNPGLLAEACGAADFGLGALAGKLADLLAGEDTAGSLLVKWDLDRQVEELAGPEADPIVRLLARRSGLCLLHAAAVEARVAAQVEAGGTNPRLLEVLDRAADKADRRLNRAMRTLLTARKLLAPAAPVRVEATVTGRVEVSGAVAVEATEPVKGDGHGVDLAAMLRERVGIGGESPDGRCLALEN
jgi:hypothetical protein